MTTSITDPNLAQGMLDTTAMQQRQRQIDSMRRELNAGPKDKATKLREACEGFESVFIQKMWEQMRATVSETGLMKSKDEKIWQGMYDQELSKKMASAGGIGLADMMMTQLGRNLEEAAPKTLNTSLNQRREPMPIAPAPLFAPPPKSEAEAVAAAPAADIYSGAAPAVAEVPTKPEQMVDNPEFEDLLGRLQVEMQQPTVVRTRITTNARSLASFENTIEPPVRRSQPPRVVVDQPTLGKTLPPVPAKEPGPSLSPTAVNEARTEAVAVAPQRLR